VPPAEGRRVSGLDSQGRIRVGASSVEMHAAHVLAPGRHTVPQMGHVIVFFSSLLHSVVCRECCPADSASGPAPSAPPPHYRQGYRRNAIRIYSCVREERSLPPHTDRGALARVQLTFVVALQGVVPALFAHSDRRFPWLPLTASASGAITISGYAPVARGATYLTALHWSATVLRKRRACAVRDECILGRRMLLAGNPLRCDPQPATAVGA
jgi:hypothetical protein